MNCGEFEKVIGEVARERLMDAAERAEALAHAGGCARCAARLADERALAGALRAVAGRTAGAEAPPRLEAALLDAFRANRAAAPPRRGRFAGWRRLAAAAAVVAVAGTAGWLALRASVDAPAEIGSAQTGPTPVKVGPGSGPPPGQTHAPTPPAAPKVGPDTGPLTEAPDIRRVRHGARRPRPATEVPKATEAPTTGRPDSEEITTDFLPVMYGGNLAPLESGHVVRVELPRSALVSVGLPMNAERADERVVADVLVGQDGLARAIRFVH